MNNSNNSNNNNDSNNDNDNNNTNDNNSNNISNICSITLVILVIIYNINNICKTITLLENCTILVEGSWLNHRRVTYEHIGVTYEWHTSEIQVHENDIRMECKIILICR